MLRKHNHKSSLRSSLSALLCHPDESHDLYFPVILNLFQDLFTTKVILNLFQDLLTTKVILNLFQDLIKQKKMLK